MKRTTLLLLILLAAGLCFKAVDVEADSSSKYTYVSDTERWYYEKVAYERPYVNWIYYPYYYNATHYNLVYYPYYTIGHSYRNVKVYEYFLTVKTDLTGPSVTGEGWYKEGTSASISAEKTVEVGGETKYHFSRWSGDFSGSTSSGTLTMDRAKTVVANYKASHHLQAMSSPLEALGFIEDGWYEEGATRILKDAPTIVKAEQGKRYVFEAWYVDGRRVAGNPITVKVDEPQIVEARYRVQYYLDVKSSYGSPIGTGWYDEEAPATFEVTTPVEAGIGRKWVFEQWRGDVATSSPQGTIIMDGVKTVTATWRLDSTILYIMYGLILAAVIVIVLVITLLIARPGMRIGAKPVQNCPSCGYRLAGDFLYCPICGSEKPVKPSKTGKGG